MTGERIFQAEDVNITALQAEDRPVGNKLYANWQFHRASGFLFSDDGNEATPDYLVELDTGFAVAIPRSYLEQPFLAGELLELGVLPKSGIAIGARFYGDTLPISGKIVTDNIWRNDDLPYLVPINPKNLPSEVIDAFRTETA